jgi:hypothetical protein
VRPNRHSRILASGPPHEYLLLHGVCLPQMAPETAYGWLALSYHRAAYVFAYWGVYTVTSYGLSPTCGELYL